MATKASYWDGTTWVAVDKTHFTSWSGTAWTAPSDVKSWNGSSWQTIFPASVGITLRATTSNTALATNGIGVTVPVSVQTGDMLVLVAAQTNFGSPLFNAVSGWTKQGEQRAGGAGYTLAIYTRLAQAGDASSTVTVTSAATENMAVQIRAYSGVNQTTPLDTSVVFAQVDPAATSGSAPAVTIATASAEIIAIYGVPTTTGTTLTAANWTDPSSFNNELTTCSASGSTNNCALASYDRIASSTGSQGPFSATITQSRRWAMATIALRPA
jgi:hypothetical protein